MSMSCGSMRSCTRSLVMLRFGRLMACLALSWEFSVCERTYSFRVCRNWEFNTTKECPQCGLKRMGHYCWWNKYIMNPIRNVGFQGKGRTAMIRLKHEVIYMFANVCPSVRLCVSIYDIIPNVGFSTGGCIDFPLEASGTLVFICLHVGSVCLCVSGDDTVGA